MSDATTAAMAAAWEQWINEVPCEGFPGACGAPAERPCEVGCPSLATEAADATPVCECDDELVPGACPGFNGRNEVQRCDMCERFASDTAAAEALAAAVGGQAEERYDPGLREGARWSVVVRGGRELTATEIGTGKGRD